MSNNTVDIKSDNFEDLVIVKDYLGGVFWPTFNFNGIGDFIPGHGY